ncbi:hypothetical protein Rt10032_c16g5767 [Rhodotorula toruloides]|uniref:Proteophosphoglycan ppg4 n=1 Tax=Rhodotorula toruloides TaxID=5286 RepID=A0A511KMZ1_RHOTO|nr:hypothetical protein Rt10032_c16g5767 [Rhodotorula toruloides]
MFPQRTSFSTADEFFAECSKRLRAQFGYPANPSKRKDDKVTLDGSWFVQSKACTWEHSHPASTTPLPLPVSTEPLPPSQPPAITPPAVSTAADPPRPSPSSAHPESDPQLAPIATRLALLVIPHVMLSFLGYSLSEEMQQVVLDELEQRLRLQL